MSFMYYLERIYLKVKSFIVPPKKNDKDKFIY